MVDMVGGNYMLVTLSGQRVKIRILKKIISKPVYQNAEQ